MMTLNININGQVIRRIKIHQIKQTDDADGRMYYYEYIDLENTVDFKTKLDAIKTTGVISHKRNDGALKLVQLVVNKIMEAKNE